VDSFSSRHQPINEQAEDIKKGLHLLAVALKNLSLYPARSQANRQTLGQARQWFSQFFTKNSDLTLLVAKDRLTDEDGTTVYQEKAAESIICGPMFRDGIQALIFEPTITEEEIRDFLLILNRFRHVNEDDTDDLVTIMWQASFPSIKYQVADEYAEVEPEFDTAAMRAAKFRSGNEDFGSPLDALAPVEVDGIAPIAKNLASLFALAAPPGVLGGSSSLTHGPATDSPGQAGQPEARHPAGHSNPHDQLDKLLDQTSALSEAKGQEPNYGPGGETIADPNGYVDPGLSNLAEACAELALDNFSALPLTPEESQTEKRLNFWGLTTEESQRVAALVKWDESLDISYSALDILLVVISSPVMSPRVEALTSAYLAEEARRSILNLELKNFNYFWDRLQKESQIGPNSPTMAIKEELKRAIGRAETIEPLFSTQYPPEKIEAAYADLRYFLYQLPFEAMKTLGLKLAKIQSPRLRELVVEVVAYVYTVSHPEENFAVILATLNEATVGSFLKIFFAQGRTPPAQLMNALTRHANPKVRAAVAKATLERDPSLISHMLHLAIDPAVTQILRPFLAQRREPSVENYLLTHLRDSYQEAKKPRLPDILECYRTLGVCASATSLPFLAEALLKKRWKSLVSHGPEPHRLGAALALSMMRANGQAGEILDKAAHSAFGAIRGAVKEAQRQLTQGRT
jgi:hypothetical protein